MSGFKQLNPFLRIFLVATIAFVGVSVLPLFFISTLLCWAIVGIAGWRYPLEMIDKIKIMSSPTGYAIGMGALMGAAVNLAGVIVMVMYTSAMLSMATSAARSVSSAGDSGSQAVTAGAVGALGLGAMGWMLSAVAAPFWGAILGAFGGLIGGSQIPKAALSSDK